MKFKKAGNGIWAGVDKSYMTIRNVMSGQGKVFRLYVNKEIIGEFGTYKDAVAYANEATKWGI